MDYFFCRKWLAALTKPPAIFHLLLSRPVGPGGGISLAGLLIAERSRVKKTGMGRRARAEAL
jgi:hypothetical protein